jgi:hypothetical protein
MKDKKQHTTAMDKHLNSPSLNEQQSSMSRNREVQLKGRNISSRADSQTLLSDSVVCESTIRKKMKFFQSPVSFMKPTRQPLQVRAVVKGQQLQSQPIRSWDAEALLQARVRSPPKQPAMHSLDVGEHQYMRLEQLGAAADFAKEIEHLESLMKTVEHEYSRHSVVKRLVGSQETIEHFQAVEKGHLSKT